MNPIPVLIIVSALSRGQGAQIKLPGYFDTFQMEMLLDKLHGAVDALERVNRLNQIIKEPASGRNSAEKLKESLNTVRGILPEGPGQTQLNNLAGAMGGLKQFGDLQGLMQSAGPILKLLSQSGAFDSSADSDRGHE